MNVIVFPRHPAPCTFISARQSTKNAHNKVDLMTRVPDHRPLSCLKVLDFLPAWVAAREPGLDDLDLSVVLTGTRLLERHRRPRLTPLNKGISRLDPDGKCFVEIQGGDHGLV